MRIGIDIRDLGIARTGARTYLEETLSALQSASGHEVVPLHPQNVATTRDRSRFARVAEHAAFAYWKQVQLPLMAKERQCDVLFCTDYTVPLQTSIPAIPVFYDASFWAHPEQYNWIWRKSLDLLTVPAAKRAPAVVTISEFARKNIIAYTGISPDRIIAIPIAPKTKATHSLADADVSAILARYTIDVDVPYILHVGVMEKRKNLVRLVEAFALFQQQVGTPYQLVLVGQPGPRADMDDSANIREAVTALGLADSVRMAGHVPDEALPALYQGASMFVFPSLREGFGIPILEAFNHDLPVAAANSSAIPEVAGDAALLFEPTDPQDIAAAMLRVAGNEVLRNQLIGKGRARRQQFSWDKTAQELITLFERVIAKR
ncbi:MAG: glycosyltransferase family 4 protein [Caldilineaceae bacterium]|nr:glycosyltransferase family 4 protein [Caldilineaceae bacterium]